MTDLVLWGRPTSTNVQKVLWLLDELGVPFAHRIVGGAHGGLDDVDFQALNPNGTIPVLQDGKLSVWESHAILRYLGDRFGAETFWPRDPAARSQIDRWLDWQATTAWPPIRLLFLEHIRDGTLPLDSPSAKAALARIDMVLARIADQVGDCGWMALDRMTLADIPLAVSVSRLSRMGLGLDLPSPVVDWMARIAVRPGFAVVRDSEDRLWRDMG